MHYTGTIWRPPYEAASLLLQVAAGCTHHKCKFCTLYDDLPFDFKMSSVHDIEADLKEVQNRYFKRVFLTGANPFVLKHERLMEIAALIHKYLPQIKTIGCFSRITDISLKSDDELQELKNTGYDGLTIGIETGDNEALEFMNKGYQASDILEQCKRLANAQISYKFFYLAGISGAGRGEDGARATAELCNQLHPQMVGANMLTIYHNSELYQEIKKGNWTQESEIEKYQELKTLVEKLEISTEFAALGASNAIQLQGFLPKDKKRLIHILDEIIKSVAEEDLLKYRANLRHL